MNSPEKNKVALKGSLALLEHIGVVYIVGERS